MAWLCSDSASEVICLAVSVLLMRKNPQCNIATKRHSGFRQNPGNLVGDQGLSSNGTF
jgi:hypothetical protein